MNRSGPPVLLATVLTWVPRVAGRLAAAGLHHHRVVSSSIRTEVAAGGEDALPASSVRGGTEADAIASHRPPLSEPAARRTMGEAGWTGGGPCSTPAHPGFDVYERSYRVSHVYAAARTSLMAGASR
jgi:hypothetical protein